MAYQTSRLLEARDYLRNGFNPLTFAARKAGKGKGKGKGKKDEPNCKNSQECNIGGKRYCIPDGRICGGKRKKAADPAKVEALRKLGGKFDGYIGGKKNGIKYTVTPEMLEQAHKLGVSQGMLKEGRVPTKAQSELRRVFNRMTIGDSVTKPKVERPEPKPKAETPTPPDQPKADPPTPPERKKDTSPVKMNEGGTDYFMVDTVTINGLPKGDPRLAGLIRDANGLSLIPSALRQTGIEDFEVIGDPKVAAAARSAYEQEKDPKKRQQLEMTGSIVIKDAESAQRQLKALADDTGFEIPDGAKSPMGIDTDVKTFFGDDTKAPSRDFTFDHSEIRTPPRNFDPDKIEGLARDILKTGGLVRPVPVVLLESASASNGFEPVFAPVAGFKAYAAAKRASELDPTGTKGQFRGMWIDPNNPAERAQLEYFYGDSSAKKP